MAGSPIQLAVRRDDGTPRLGFWHRNEMTALPEGGMRMTIIPDPQGPYFTTICTFDYYNAQDWPERIVASLANPEVRRGGVNNDTLSTAKITMENQPTQSGGTAPAVVSSALFGDFVRRHALAVENLTEQQLAEAIRQAIAAGDFQRNVMNEGGTHKQAVIYLPYREVSRLRPLYDELIYAVATKHDDETRHETALRYITERENRVEGPCSSSPNKKDDTDAHSP